MSKDKEFLFKINAYTPATIPMSRLAEYMADLAALLGEKQQVHFKELVPGSTGLKAVIEHEAEPKVRERVRLVYSDAGPADAMAAMKAINKKLKEDNGDAVITDYNSAEIIIFPGIKEEVAPVFGPITQSGSIDGTIIKIGGKNDTVSVAVETRDGQDLNCRARKGLAKELGQYIFGQEIRFNGVGKWTRNEDGLWVMDSFIISGYEPLDNRSLVETVSDLRNVKGSGWAKVSDPWKELDDIRGDE